jgi:DNA adenine methylase
MKSLTPYYGGKANATGEKIASFLPPHRIYVEPCGGMAGVLMQKPVSHQEVYNDIDSNIVNLFRVVRDKKQCKELLRKLKLTPYSRDEWKFCRNNYQFAEDKIEKARMVYVLLSMGFLGSMGNKSFSFGGINYQSCTARTFANSLKGIEAISERISNIIIENQDVLKICKRWDSPQTCFYLDPPYLPETRVTRYDYTHEMKLDQHEALLQWCLKAKGMILISGYFSQLYARILETNGWRRRDMETYSRGSKSNGKGYEAKRTECLWYNQLAFERQDLPLFSKQLQFA